VSVFNKPPRLKAFQKEEFLKAVANSSECIRIFSHIFAEKSFLGGSKSKEVELYNRFVQSVNFSVWFNERKKQATHKLSSLYQRAIIEANIPLLVKQKKEIEIVDLYLRIKEQLVEIAELFVVTMLQELSQGQPHQVVCRLQEHMEAILVCMPADLQTSLNQEVRVVLIDNAF
jgi:hypothetical protein